MAKARVRDPRVTLAAQGEMVERHEANIGALWQQAQHADQEVRRLYTGIDNLFRRAKVAAFWPWPLSILVWWWMDRQMMKEIRRQQELQAIAEYKARQEAEKAQQEEPTEDEESAIVTPVKPILDAGGNVVSIVDPQEADNA